MSASFILIAEVIEVAWRELADGSPRRYDALDFFHAQQFSSLFNNGNFLQKKIVWTTLESKLRHKKKKNWKSSFAARHTFV